MSKIVCIQFEAAINKNATDEQIKEWVRFNIADKGEIDMTNPLWNEALRPMPGSVEIDIQEVSE